MLKRFPKKPQRQDWAELHNREDTSTCSQKYIQMQDRQRDKERHKWEQTHRSKEWQGIKILLPKPGKYKRSSQIFWNVRPHPAIFNCHKTNTGTRTVPLIWSDFGCDMNGHWENIRLRSHHFSSQIAPRSSWKVYIKLQPYEASWPCSTFRAPRAGVSLSIS